MRPYLQLGNVTTVIFSILLFLLTLNNNATLSVGGLVSIFALLGVCMFLFFIYILKRQLKVYLDTNKVFFLSTFIIFLFIYLIAYFRFPNFMGLKNLIQLFLIFSFAIFVGTVKWDYYKIKILGRTSMIFIFLNFIFWIISGMENNYKAHMGNPNSFAAYLLPLSFFVFSNIIFEHKKINKILYFFIVILLIMLIFMTNTRSVLLAGLGGVISYITLDKIIKNNLFYKLLFITVVISSVAFTFIYPQIYQYPKLFNWLNEISMLFGKSFYSGRNILWQQLIDSIDNPWFGIGAGANPLYLIDSTSSSHNLYIQLLMQVGIVGLCVFFLILYSIWISLRTNYLMYKDVTTRKIIKLSASFLIAVIIHQTFELTFTQNNFGIGLIQWLVILIGLSVDLKTSLKKKDLSNSKV